MKPEKQFLKLLGEIVSGARLEKGLTQKELGMEIGYAENSAGQVIHKIEEGKIAIPKRKITKLMEALNITPDKLGLEQSVSLPMWISSQGKKGGSKTIKDFISTAGALASGVVGLSETVATGVAELSETIVTGMVGISESVTTGLNQVKHLDIRKKRPVILTDAQKLEMIDLLCSGNKEHKYRICEILNIKEQE
ncbi:MAG: helix-turn-helix transcriptional regulator [SAR324 cluster bacterium]|nr:helix-turn-helix transcriptional regulator [SAR324 cluster bacterium]MBF0351845.1 helix-turn-helix transcriptional regulator [SAR324 cluster bacterium]